ncbi:TonB-dependent receptor domain-containing protein [Roseateles sp.]|uniref:TonB-dependent receptor domain-containing protein n=1 Tax=Roseateles sp. TaxID=1971397 RepID=UPI003BA85D30
MQQPPWHGPVRACASGWVMALAAPVAATAQADEPQRLAPVVVTATRSEAAAFDVPASITRIGADEVRDGHALVNISESLAGVPGLLARDRQNYAQDVQISVRGFGARSTFGIRGVRLYVDGIPATLPDGQGQISNVELGSVGRIEVLRGPFSALYGNSAGGVIQVFTEDGRGPPTLSFNAAAGSDGLLRLGAQARGASGPLGYVLGVSRLTSDGYRDHSATERRLGNAKLTWRPDGDSRFTLVANSVALPEAQDPLGLTRAQWAANPRGVDASALDYDTRKTVNQTQLGVVYERRLDAANALQLTAYGGHRGTAQFQAIPRATQASALHPGGVIDLARDYRGADLRWTLKSQLLAAPLTVIAGLAHDTLDEQRRGYLNYAGTPVAVLGVLGALRRDETNTVTSTDPYVQASWQPAPDWTVNAGVRRSRVRFDSADHYVVGANPDDSGRASYGATLPVLGVVYAPADAVRLYATAGRGYETPTLNELAYRAGGGTGLNLGLQAATSHSVEAGVKLRWGGDGGSDGDSGGGGEATAAVFQTRTAHEIVTQTNSGGRATYQNAGATQRRGVELALEQRWARHLRAQLSATVLSATYVDGFLTCTATPCATANMPIAAGNRLPGIARGALFASLGWLPPTGWRGGVEARALSAVAVNDANTDAVPAHAVAAAHAGYVLAAGAWALGGFVRADNLFDRHYVGSVIVNEGNGRFFEPAPGRTWLASVSASVKF